MKPRVCSMAHQPMKAKLPFVRAGRKVSLRAEPSDRSRLFFYLTMISHLHPPRRCQCRNTNHFVRSILTSKLPRCSLFFFMLFDNAWSIELWGVCYRSKFIHGRSQPNQLSPVRYTWRTLRYPRRFFSHGMALPHLYLCFNDHSLLR